jgi:hypothetical protein
MYLRHSTVRKDGKTHTTGRGDQIEIFEEPAHAGETIRVRLDQIRLERPRGLGDAWLSWTLWRALGLDV